MDIRVEFLIDELTNLYKRYQSQDLRNDIVICLDILKYYDFNEENNQIFASYVLRVLYILKAKIEENTDLTTDLSNLIAKGYVSGNMRSVFHRKFDKDPETFKKEVDFYVERNYFDEEYERLERLILKNATKLIGIGSTLTTSPNYSKTLTNLIQLLDNQELALRLQAIVIKILKPFEVEKNKFLEKQENIVQKLVKVVKKRDEYLEKYNKIFNQ